jgi:hypothetical protein
MNAELRKGFGTEVRKFMVLPVSPQVFNRIQLRSICGQELERDSAVLVSHKVPHQAASVNRSSVPDQKQIAVDVAHQMRKKVNHLTTADTAGIEPKIELPPRHSCHRRERLPIERILYYRRLSPRRPSSTTVRALAQSAFVDKHYRAALPLGFFLSCGQRFFFQCSIEASFRSRARPVGLWQLQPSFLNNHHTWPRWYRTPHSSSISFATRSSVQSPVSYPNVSGPALSPRSTFLKSASLSRGLRPARPAFFNPPRPASAICLRHRPTDWRCTPICRATSASVMPCLISAYARSRRSSNASKSLLTPAGFPMQKYLSQPSPNVTIFNEYQ